MLIAQNSDYTSVLNIAGILGRDRIYLRDCSMIQGWVWNEKDSIIVGEKLSKKIFIYYPADYTRIERDSLLRYLLELI